MFSLSLFISMSVLHRRREQKKCWVTLTSRKIIFDNFPFSRQRSSTERDAADPSDERSADPLPITCKSTSMFMTYHTKCTRVNISTRRVDSTICPRFLRTRSHWPLKAHSDGAFFFVCDCDLFTCNFMKLFTWCDRCGCDLLCIHIGITHCNHTEWVWNPFMCDIAHRNASYAEQITPCEHFPKPTYNPFYFIKSHVNKSLSQTKNTPRERAFNDSDVKKWVEYTFLSMITNANDIAKMSVWKDP